ncbi:MAG TPA: hypothetical protein VL096_06065, partial [Pirellulaceae bacterium]|nr:hypothetical protein [Pirellulaceae bacterium]
AARDLNRAAPTYRDDHFARRGKKHCLAALKIARILRRRGIATPPAPRFLRREIEQYVRAKAREFPKSTELLALLPPAWQAFCKAMMHTPDLYVDTLQANPEVAESFEMTPKPVVEYVDTFDDDIPPDNSAVTTKEETETTEVAAVCVASEERKPTEQATETARNNLASPPAPQPQSQPPKSTRTYSDNDPFRFALPVLRVTRELPGQHISEWARERQAKGS